jgi:hypothetical protein
MYDAARVGCLLFEPYDNLVTRLGVALGIGQKHELAAVYFNDSVFGGVANTAVPNYVYRWTRREIIKTINSHAPYGRHRFKFYHRLRIPWGALKGRRNKIYIAAALLALPVLKILGWLFPRQTNNFAAVVLKPARAEDTFPWLMKDAGEYHLNKSWLARKYNGSR